MLKEFVRDNTDKCLELIQTEDLTVTDKKSGNSLIQIAIQNSNLQIVNALIKQNADLNYINPKDGSTPLISALQSNNLAILQALLQSKRCDVEHLYEKKSYLSHSAVLNSPEFLRLLLKYKVPLDHNANGTALHYAINQEQQENAIFLIQAGISLEQVDDDGDTAIHLMAASGNAELLRVVVDRVQAKPDSVKLGIFNQANGEGNCPIHLAALNDRSLFLTQLIKHQEVLDLKLEVKNKAGLTYNQLVENMRIQQQREKEDQIIRKRQNEQDRQDRALQRRQEQQKQEQEEREAKIRRKEEEKLMIVKKQQEESKFRWMMLGVLILVIVGFYLFLELSIKSKDYI